MFEFYVKKGKINVRIAESAEENFRDLSPKKVKKQIKLYEEKLKELIATYGKERICFLLATCLEAKENFVDEILMWSDTFSYEEIFNMIENDMEYFNKSIPKVKKNKKVFHIEYGEGVVIEDKTGLCKEGEILVRFKTPLSILKQSAIAGYPGIIVSEDNAYEDTDIVSEKDLKEL